MPNKQKFDIRESNPGQLDGNELGYHYPNVELMKVWPLCAHSCTRSSAARQGAVPQADSSRKGSRYSAAVPVLSRSSFACAMAVTRMAVAVVALATAARLAVLASQLRRGRFKFVQRGPLVGESRRVLFRQPCRLC